MSFLNVKQAQSTNKTNIKRGIAFLYDSQGIIDF